MGGCLPSLLLGSSRPTRASTIQASMYAYISCLLCDVGVMNVKQSGTEAEIQIPLKRFSNSSVSSLFRNWLILEGHPGHQNLTPIPMDKQPPNGDWSTSRLSQLL